MSTQDTPLAARTILPGVAFDPPGTSPEVGGVPGQRGAEQAPSYEQQQYQGQYQGQQQYQQQYAEAPQQYAEAPQQYQQPQQYAAEAPQQYQQYQQYQQPQQYAEAPQQYAQPPQYQQPQYQPPQPQQQVEPQQQYQQPPEDLAQQYQPPEAQHQAEALQQYQQYQQIPQYQPTQQYEPQTSPFEQQYQQQPAAHQPAYQPSPSDTQQYQQPQQHPAEQQQPQYAPQPPAQQMYQPSAPPSFPPTPPPYRTQTFASPPPPTGEALWGPQPHSSGAAAAAPAAATGAKRRFSGRGSKRRHQAESPAEVAGRSTIPVQPEQPDAQQKNGLHRKLTPANTGPAPARSPRRALMAGGAGVLLAGGGLFAYTQLGGSSSSAPVSTPVIGAGALRFASPTNVAGLPAESVAAAAATRTSVTAALARRAPGTPAPAKVLAFGTGASAVDVAVYRGGAKTSGTGSSLIRGLSQPRAGDRAIAARVVPAGAAGGQMTCGGESGKTAGSWCVWTGTTTTGVTQAPGSTDVSGLAAKTRELRAYAEH